MCFGMIETNCKLFCSIFLKDTLRDVPLLSSQSSSLTGVLADLDFHKTNATHLYPDSNMVHQSAGVIKLIECSIEQNFPIIYLVEFLISYV